MTLDWDAVIKKKKPTKKQIGLYHAWKKYLSDSRLTPEQIEKDARSYAERNRKVPKD